jgi:tetratricopeptide (TPR) repeat protein
MAEPVSYPGSPSLSAEARDKVLQTFRHTLEMARAGRNEDALLGCDFILKMDTRFTPARRLLASLRGVAVGTVVDLSEFEALGGAPVPGTPAPPAPAPPAVPPATPASGWAAPAGAPPPAGASAPAADPFASGLDGLGFDDLGANPFAPAPSPAEAAPAPASFSPAPDFGFDAPAPRAFDSPVPELSYSPEPPPAADPFAGAAPSPDAPSFPAPAPDFSAPSAPPAEPFAATVPAPGPGAAATDPRILQFLRQGDDAQARGQLQEAIDLWSRVFLIDLSNEEASRRIDAAREKQSEAARQLDVLLSEGVQLYEAGDLQSARNAFLKVLTVSETDATARNYLNQIDAALSVQGGGAPPVEEALPVEPYMRDELESPIHPSFADGLPSLEEGSTPATGFGEDRPSPSERRDEAAARGGKIDGRILIGVAVLVLAGVALAAWLFFKPRPAAPPSVTDDVPAATTAPAQNPLEKAQSLFKQGKVEEALAILTAIPTGDPRHDMALVLIDQFKSSAEPRPSTRPAVSEAEVDEARLSGLASLSSGRYIDAVKSLDLVVKARPDDEEASLALARAREAVSAVGSAIRAYNEQDYESAQRLLWDLRKSDPRNKDVEDYLFKSYFNEGVLNLQTGSTKKAAEAFKDAAALRPQDAEAQRHLKFARRYAGGLNDLAARIYVRHVTPRP